MIKVDKNLKLRLSRDEPGYGDAIRHSLVTMTITASLPARPDKAWRSEVTHLLERFKAYDVKITVTGRK